MAIAHVNNVFVCNLAQNVFLGPMIIQLMFIDRWLKVCTK